MRVLTRPRSGFSFPCFSFVVSLCLFLPNLVAESASQSFSFAVEENAQAGTKLGQFPAEDLQGGKLTYQLLPDLPTGLVPRMWLDASGLSVAEKRWEDKSGKGNHASMQGSAQGYPVVVRDVQNGHSVMRYFGWGDVEERAGAWKTSDWFGNFISYEKGWLYHVRLGWLYSSPASESSVWLWKDNFGWLWTKEEVYPYMWSDQTGNWMYIYPGEIGEPLKIFDYSTQSYQ